ncbi:MAG: hypothetical protein AMXMBFR84_05840 [Candidatus Hydrogenedentota bacterium]
MTINPVLRRRVVGVMGSGTDAHQALSEEAGRVIGELGCDLLTGGGGGVMAAVAKAFVCVPLRAGLSIGVIRGESRWDSSSSSRTYTARGPNEFVELPIFTHLPLSGRQGKDLLSRNHINVLTPAVIVVLPGESGTRSELELAVDYGRPVILFLGTALVDGENAASLERSFSGRAGVARDAAELRNQLSDILG